MNLKAKCVNPKCRNNGYEKSVVVGQLHGLWRTQRSRQMPCLWGVDAYDQEYQRISYKAGFEAFSG